MRESAGPRIDNLVPLKGEYDAFETHACRFRDELVQQLTALVSNKGIRLGFPIEARVKSWDSICSKIYRLSLRLSSLKQMPDLIGVRLVVLFRRDAEQLCKLLSETFTVLEQEDTGERLSADQFGYLSTHFLVKLPEHWLSTPSLASLGDLSAEIQVRTSSQHIWAAASHVLQYKNESNVPLPVRRSIHRVSALLETVDLEFERVLAQREEYRAELDVSSSEPLNTDSLEKLLDSLLPAANKQEGENLSVLLRELADFDVRTAGQLGNIVKKHLKAALKEDTARVRDYPIKDKLVGLQRHRILEKGVYFSHVGLVRVAMSKEYGKRWHNYMLKLALKYMRKDDPRRKILEKELAGQEDSSAEPR